MIDDGPDVDVLLANAPLDFPALHDLLGGYLGFGWERRWHRWEDAITAFRSTRGTSLAVAAAEDIAVLLGSDVDVATLRLVVVAGLECNVATALLNVGLREWLQQVADLLHRPAQTEPSAT